MLFLVLAPVGVAVIIALLWSDNNGRAAMWERTWETLHTIFGMEKEQWKWAKLIAFATICILIIMAAYSYFFGNAKSKCTL